MRQIREEHAAARGVSRCERAALGTRAGGCDDLPPRSSLGAPGPGASPCNTTRADPLDWRLRTSCIWSAVDLLLLLASPLLLLYPPVLPILLRRRAADRIRRSRRPEREHVEAPRRPGGPRRHEPVQRHGHSEARLVSPDDPDLRALDRGLHDAPHLHAGSLRARQHHPLTPLNILDDKQRLLSPSNYDGSLESYMDDFVEQGGVRPERQCWPNSVGYPRTRWLVLDGAKDGRSSTYYIRRHELPTEVWCDPPSGPHGRRAGAEQPD